jgi:leucine-zipper of insertion element IS481
VLHASHPNAALTPKARLKLGRLVHEDGWSTSAAARRFEVDYKTAQRWAGRCQEAKLAAADLGREPVADDMQERSSRPHHQPGRAPRPVVKKIVKQRWRHRLGPVEIGHQLGMPASTVHAVLKRCRLNRLSHIDRRTGERSAATNTKSPAR